MGADVEVCNRAMGHLGNRDQIADLGEKSTEAIQCSLHFNALRDAMLRGGAWAFATKRAYLPSVETTQFSHYNYSYGYPADCLRPRYILPTVPGNSPPPFELAAADDLNGKIIFTNKDEAVLVYTAKVTNPAVWDAMFMEAFEFGLAARTCMAITVDSKLAVTLGAFYAAKLREAKAMTMNEQSPQANQYRAPWHDELD